MPVDYTPLLDEELAARIAQGDREALGLVYDRYARVVFSVSLRLIGERPVAEEVTQEVFVNLWLRAGTYSADKGKFSTWLLSIAHNRAVDQLRRMHREGKSVPLEGPEMDHAATDGPDPAQETSTLADRQAVRRSVDQLPPQQREVLVLAYYHGLTQVEIANQLGAPLGTVKTRMRLGLLKLRDMLRNLNREERDSR